jgi:hypothetical protein
MAPDSSEGATQNLIPRRLLLKPTKVGVVVRDEVLQRASCDAAHQVVAVRPAKECEQAGAIDRPVAEDRPHHEELDGPPIGISVIVILRAGVLPALGVTTPCVGNLIHCDDLKDSLEVLVLDEGLEQFG